MKLAVLLMVILVLVVACNSHNETQKTEIHPDYKLSPSDYGINVFNTGNTTSDALSIDYNIYWFANIHNGTNESYAHYIHWFNATIPSGEQKMIAGLDDCIPKDVFAAKEYNIFRCVVTLKAGQQEMDTKTLYVYFGEERGKATTYLLDKEDYEKVREYVQQEYQRLQGKI